MTEIPEEAIQAAEAELEAERAHPGHSHDGVSGEDGTLRTHLVEVHDLDVPGTTSPSTQAGLHDRLHGDTAASDD